MQLLVIRHAIATERSPADTAVRDRARPLTERGRRRFAQAVRGLGALGLRCDRVLHSPWTRAAETAALLEPVVAGDLEEVSVAADSLAGPPRAQLLAELAALRDQRVCVVGHEPWLGQLVALLTAGGLGGAGQFAFRKGGVAWLEGEPARGAMQLRAFLPPRVLRQLR